MIAALVAVLDYGWRDNFYLVLLGFSAFTLFPLLASKNALTVGPRR
jgi:hypothetical protein